MAAIVAAQSGNWSATSTWTGGVLPSFGDSANSNGFSVVIDQDIDLAAGSLIGSNAGAGGFTVSAARAIVANIVATVRAVLTCSHAAGTVTVTGAVAAGTGGSAIVNSSTGTLAVTGNVTGGSASNINGVQNSSTGPVTITGDVTGGSGADGARNVSTGSITINGNVFGGAGGSGVNNAAAGTVTVNGNAQGAGSAGQGVINSSTGTVVVTGTATGGFGGSGNGVRNDSGGIATVGKAIGNNYGPGGGTVQGAGVQSINTGAAARTYVYALEYGPYGMSPVTGHVRLIPDALNQVQVQNNVLTPLILGTVVSTPDFPHTSNVRNGTLFDFGNKTGDLLVPSPSSVALGVGTDHTVGTAVLSAAAAAAAILDALTADHDTAGTIGLAIGSGGGGASVEDIRTELSVELARLDATVSSRATQVSVDDLPTNAELATSQAAADDATLAAIAALTIPTVADILSGVIEGSITLKGALRLALAVLSGKSTGGGTTTVTFRDVADAKARITATVDSNGNRTAVTRDIAD